jgi:hypothetical protein
MEVLVLMKTTILNPETRNSPSRPRAKALAGLMLLFGMAAQGQVLRSLQTGTNPATMNVTSYVFGTDRYEFRVHGLTLPVSQETRLFSIAEPFSVARCVILAGTSTLRCLYQNDSAPNGFLQANLGTRSDFRVRYQRDVSLRSSSIEVWDGDCRNYLKNEKTTGPGVQPPYTGNFGIGGLGARIAFFRAYTGLDTSGSCPLDAPSATANRIDFRFDNDTTADLAVTGRSLSAPGSSYGDSPAYAPLAAISGGSTLKPTFRAGKPFTLSGLASTTFSGSGLPQSYTWRQSGGPEALEFQSRSGATAEIIAPVQGSYRVDLVVTDSQDRTGETSWDFGVVASDDNGVLILPDPEMEFVLDPLTQHGVSPWPWYDVAEAAGADVLLPYMTQPVINGNTPAQGTISIQVANNGIAEGFICCNPIVTGQGTQFLTDLKQGDSIWIWWDRDGDGSYKGRTLSVVGTITSDTQFRLGDYYWVHPESRSLNMRFSKAGIDAGYYTQAAQPNTSWNYYEALLGIYRLHHRTGLQSYRDQARTFCDLWWTYGLDSGSRITVPRNSGWQSMMACALDFQPGWIEPIANNITRNARSGTNRLNPSAPLRAGSFDLREASYITRATAVAAKLYPPRSNDPAGKRIEWCSYVANQVNNVWLAGFTQIGTKYGYWQEDLYSQNLSYPAAAIPQPNGQFGASPWRANGLINLALIKVHQILTDPDVCPNAVMADQVADMIERSSRFVWDYSRSPDGGVFYNVLYESAQGEDNTKPVNAGVGTISVNNGSTTVTGVGTSFLTLFAPCNGTTYIGIRANDEAFRSVYQVLSCESNTSLTLSVPHTGATRGGIQLWHRAYQASRNCGPHSIAPFCEAASYGGRLLTHDLTASMAWMFYRTQDALWKDRLDWFGGRAYGGSAGGPGTPGPPAGPQADGNPNNFDSVLPQCGSPPCGEPGRFGGPLTQLSKPFGLSAGAGNAQSVFAYRLGGAKPLQPVDVKVNFTLIAGATSCRVRVMAPTGIRTSTVHAASSATVQLDARQGDHRFRLEYLDSMGEVLSQSDWMVLAVPQ